MEKIYYYYDEAKDDFAATKINRKPIPKDYRYVRTDAGWKVARLAVYKVFATPLLLLVGALSCRIKNRRALRGYKKGGAFIYGNHTAYFTDAANPTRIAFPRTADIVVNADAVSIKGCGGLVRLLGAVPVPEDLHGLKRFSDDIISAAEQGHWVAIYPEAHIWPYYTGIRPFGAASFKYPARCGAPVFSFTMVYRKRLIRRRPRRVIYIDGPFFAEGDSLKERAESLRRQVYSAMCERAKLSNCAYAEYYKVNSPHLAAALNGAQAAGGARGRKLRALKRQMAERIEECNRDGAAEPYKAEEPSV